MYKKGWLGDGINMYYMDTSAGHMLKDLVEIGGKNYYFAANGLMQRGMIPLNGKIYLFGADGSMQYGWYTDASGMRYFQADGSMAVNTTLTVDGALYTFDANGLATAVPVLNPAAWVTDPATGVTVDTLTGEVISPETVAQAAALGAASVN